jgi:hypothetical protein
MSTSGMNAVVTVAITLLHPFGQPSMQRKWVVNCDLSASGVLPHHRFLWRNWLCSSFLLKTNTWPLVPLIHPWSTLFHINQNNSVLIKVWEITWCRVGAAKKMRLILFINLLQNYAHIDPTALWIKITIIILGCNFQIAQLPQHQCLTLTWCGPSDGQLSFSRLGITSLPPFSNLWTSISSTKRTQHEKHIKLLSHSIIIAW